MKSGKCWGSTNLVFSNCNNEVQYMECKAGHQCSKHCHVHKHNMFYVISGKIKILVWKNDYDLCDETILGPGERTVVKPNEYHQFQVIEDSEVLEVYWVELQLNDIERESCGGVMMEFVPTPVETEEEKKTYALNKYKNSFDDPERKSLLQHADDYIAQKNNNSNVKYEN